MRYVTCSQCQDANVPQNFSLTVNGVIYCESCIKVNIPDERELKKENVVHVLDPTVCAYCGMDNGQGELEKRGSYPICPDCSKIIGKRIFPLWVKAFFIGVVAIVVFSFFWNWRFMKAALMLKQLETTEPTEAYYLSLAEQVPEVSDFVTLAEFYKGVRLLEEGKASEARLAFLKCTDLPPEFHLNIYILSANIGHSFDTEDYSGFLTYSREMLYYDTSAIAYGRMASAYSCLYVTEHLEAMKDSALQYISIVEQSNDTNPVTGIYMDMVKYRLDQNEMITRQEFLEKYPNGWTKN